MSENTTDVMIASHAEAKKYRLKAREYKNKVSELETLLAAKTKELDALNSLPNDQAKRISELESQIRTRSHKDAFAKLAQGKIRPDALEDAYALSGWQAEGDDIDETKLGEAVNAIVEAKPYLKAADVATPETPDSVSPQVERQFSLSGRLPKPVSGTGKGPAPTETQKTRRMSL